MPLAPYMWLQTVDLALTYIRNRRDREAYAAAAARGR